MEHLREARGFERNESFPVVDVVFAFRSFEAKRDLRERRMAQNRFEAGPSDFTFAKNLVAIEPGAEGAFTIVDVQADDMAPWQLLFEALDKGVDSFGLANIKSSREQMACIEANRETFRLARAAEKSGDMFDAGAEAGALSGSHFEGNANRTVVAFKNPSE